MASEKSSGGRKGRASGSRGKSGDSKKKSGWVKPDGTPLRRRKGAYFPDKEIEKRKPALRSRTGESRPYSKDRNSDDSSTERGSRKPYNKDSEDFSRKPASGSERTYDKSPSGREERSGDFKSKSDRPSREERPRSDRKDTYKEYKSRSSRSTGDDRPSRPSRDDRPTRSRNDDRPARASREDRPTRSRSDDRDERPSRDDRPARSSDDRPARPSRDDRSERPSRDDRPTRSRSDDRDERPSRDDRPARSSDDRPARPLRDDRSERPSRDDRPTRSRSDDRDDRPSRDERPARSGDDRPERPSRDDRPVRSDRDQGSESPRREYVRKDSGKKPFEKKRERYADRDHSKEMRGRFDKRSTKSGGFEKRAPKSRSSFSGRSSSEKSEGVRLNKFIANAGICSRREADDLITAGVISVNGEIVTELGTKVLSTDEVKFHEQTLKTEKMVYVLLNKPKDYITTTDDPEERKTVMNLVHDAGKERIFPVGRLDRNTTGLLLITNDGELTKRLTHPSGNIKKIYQVELDRNLSQDDMLRAADGVELEDGPAHVDEIHYESPTEKHIVGVELHSGRNRVVRRIFEAMEYKVKKLDRVYFAGLTKKDLPRGRWRFLTELEVNMLKMQTGKKKG